MAHYRLTKPQPFLFIAFPEIWIQTVHIAGHKNSSTCMKREEVPQTCVVLKMRLPGRTGEGKNRARRGLVNKKTQGQSDRNPFLSKVQAALFIF